MITSSIVFFNSTVMRKHPLYNNTFKAKKHNDIVLIFLTSFGQLLYVYVNYHSNFLDIFCPLLELMKF